MAKFNGQLVVIEETNLSALFYYKHLLNNSPGNPVYYFDEIDKAGIDIAYKTLTDAPMGYRHMLGLSLEDIQGVIDEVKSTVYHGFAYIVTQDNIKDEGLANKLKAVEAKKIKNHEIPYDDIFKKYSVHVYNG
jgi:hypothetical protein